MSHDGRTLEYREESVRYAALSYEAEHLAWCVQAGLRESPIRPLADSLTTIRVIDEVRRHLAIAFPDGAQSS